MLAELIMDIGTLLLMIAAIPNIPAIWGTRDDLKGYSMSGAIVMFTGLCSVAIAFFMLKMSVSMWSQVLPITMWGMVVWFKWRKMRREKNGKSA